MLSNQAPWLQGADTRTMVSLFSGPFDCSAKVIV
jgi:hypothetical protein